MAQASTVITANRADFKLNIKLVIETSVNSLIGHKFDILSAERFGGYGTKTKKTIIQP
jgi:hypothetical protein